VVSHWNSVPREVVMKPSLCEFKEHLDNELSHVVLGSPMRSRELDSVILMGPFQLEIFCDSIDTSLV